MNNQDQRIDPDTLLEIINSEDANQGKGNLRIFLGMSAGVGKTYSMLRAARQKQLEKRNVLVGVVETHGRSETAQLLEGLKVLPKRTINYRGTDLEELDLDEILRLKPDLVLVDELAHSNVPESRHLKRYQDVLEILDAGIDVYTTLNVQHLESRKDSVEKIVGITIRETVPDSILERAQQIELVDIAPTELLKRLKEGKIYLGESAHHAAENFFKEDKLTALREIALRMTAERVDQDLQKFSASKDESPWQTNERLLVTVSYTVDSEKMIRATRRLAYSLEAPWIALHVDTGVILGPQEQNQLEKNLNLARELRAEVVNTSDADIVSAINRISRQKNVTQVIIPRLERRWFQDLLEGGSILDRLLKESSELDIHVIRLDNQEGRKWELEDGLSLYRSRTGWIKYYYIAWVFAFVSMLGLLVEPYIGYRAVGFIFLLAVITTGFWGSISAVFFSATLSALIWNFGFIPPRFTFAISNADDLILCFANFAVALITGFLTNRIRIREKLIRDREEKTNVMNVILQDISASPNKQEFVTRVCLRISQYFGGKSWVILKSAQGVLLFNSMSDPESLDDKEQAVALWAFQNYKNAGWSTETLSQAKCLYIPLKGVSELVGVLVYSPKLTLSKLSVEQKEFLLSIATQLGISLERHFLSQRLQETQRIKDSELLHQTLLNSISHEMRTPLTTIIGASSALEKKLQEDSSASELISHLSLASDRLNRVIENLLDMSRINSGVLGLKMEWHDPADLIGVALKKLERNLKDHPVNVTIPETLKLVEIDFRLMEHALSNLILNATQYAGPHCTIDINMELKNQKLFISIADNGIGIKPQDQKNLFEKFYRVPGTPAGGTGLGLSIVKSVIELHKGTIDYIANEPHGAKFVLQIPMKKQPEIIMETI